MAAGARWFRVCSRLFSHMAAAIWALESPAMKLLHTLGDKAAGPGDVLRASLVTGTLQELNAGLVSVYYFLGYRSTANVSNTIP
jgi:hypothetical protein